MTDGRPASVLKLITALALLLIAGCRMPAQLLFSPDGSLAAYRIEDRAYVIDASGKPVAALGHSLGGFAWSGDGKTLYAAVIADSKGPLFTPDARWQSLQKPITAATQPDDAERPTSEPSTCVELAAWTGGDKPKALIRFAGQGVVDMKLSSDGQWLAMVCPTDVTDTLAVYVYHVADKKLFVLSSAAGLGMTFTGPSRLAYIEADRQPDNLDSMTGKVVEVSLATEVEHLERTPLVDVLPAQTPYLAAIGDNLLLSAVPRTFPGKSTSRDHLTCNLYLWTRANGGLVSIADDVGPLFAVSPDGTRVLTEKITPASERAVGKRELTVIRVNGSDEHVLRDLTAHGDFALWPAWRGNDHIAFSGEEDAANNSKATPGETHRVYPVVLYRLTDRSELQSEHSLSADWDESMKPYIVTGVNESGAEVNGEITPSTMTLGNGHGDWPLEVKLSGKSTTQRSPVTAPSRP